MSMAENKCNGTCLCAQVNDFILKVNFACSAHNLIMNENMMLDDLMLGAFKRRHNIGDWGRGGA
jgi:hypothetical protein